MRQDPLSYMWAKMPARSAAFTQVDHGVYWQNSYDSLEYIDDGTVQIQ